MRWTLLMVTSIFLALPPLAGMAQSSKSASPKQPSPRQDLRTTHSPHGNLNIPCVNCHTFTSWKLLRGVMEFDHNKTKFPLQGLHKGVACTECHVSLVFTKAGTSCANCHADIHRGQFGEDCKRCHTVRGWQASLRQLRSHENRFPLIGAHAALACDDCHKSAAASQFQGLSTECVACHQQSFVQTTLPNHQAAGFPTSCQQCHNMSSWQGASFDHARFTGFPLTGIHATLDCTACHANGNFKLASTTCVSCHLKDYNGTTNPNHAQAGFPTDCAVCHSTASWQGAKFDHSTTGFPLTGVHATLSCESCHVGGNYTNLSTACANCHMKDYNGTTNPNHAQAGFPTDCAMCHSTASWQGAKFDHSTTGFPLTGVHATLSCESCHVGGNYTNLSAACASCHMKDYNGTTNPNHAQAGFPTDCSICHSTASWQGATFDHSTTGFPLTGAHATLSCESCHVGGNYTNLSSACVTCHLKDYNSTTNPNHQAAGLPQQCEVCHTTTAWIPASFNHDLTGFPLTGAHTTVPCTSCHIGGQYAGTPTDCYSCHKSDYQGTTDPNHVAANFPTDCSVCHTTTSWLGATFNHTWFPIYSGTHAGRWTTCGDCHVNPSNYAVFSCITCHAHDKSTTDGQHSGVRGYVYNSTSCYSCHPTGRGG